MKFIHIADVHLGAAPDRGFPWSDERANEIWESFRRLITGIRQEKPELLLIAGDLFHRQPLKREIREVNYLFSTIPETTVVMIAGNHDYIGPDSWYQRYPWEKNVIGFWKEDLEKAYIPAADTWVYGFSYHSREIREARYHMVTPCEKGGYHILLAHGGDDCHIPIQKEIMTASGFDYVALGHIHRPQMLVKDKMGYSGALEPLDRNDIGRHGFLRGILENGKIRTEFVPWAVRSYIPLIVNVTPDTTQFSLEDEIMDQMERKGKRNIFKIQLRGIRDAQANFDLHRLKQLGNIVDAVDGTAPDYDLELLEERYEGSLIGSYIRRFRRSGEPIEEKALQYGLQALLISKR